MLLLKKFVSVRGYEIKPLLYSFSAVSIVFEALKCSFLEDNFCKSIVFIGLGFFFVLDDLFTFVISAYSASLTFSNNVKTICLSKHLRRCHMNSIALSFFSSGAFSISLFISSSTSSACLRFSVVADASLIYFITDSSVD